MKCKNCFLELQELRQNRSENWAICPNCGNIEVGF